jgi:hypothetical protein
MEQIVLRAPFPTVNHPNEQVRLDASEKIYTEEGALRVLGCAHQQYLHALAKKTWH